MLSASQSLRNKCRIEETIGYIQKNFECPICLDLMKNPVSTKCDHKFCRHCLLETLGRKAQVACPLCKETFTKRSLQPLPRWNEIVVAVGNLVTAFQQDTGAVFSPARHPVPSSPAQDTPKKELAGIRTRKNATSDDKVPRRRPNVRQSRQKSHLTEENVAVYREDTSSSEAIPPTIGVKSNINIRTSFPVPARGHAKGNHGRAKRRQVGPDSSAAFPPDPSSIVEPQPNNSELLTYLAEGSFSQNRKEWDPSNCRRLRSGLQQSKSQIMTSVTSKTPLKSEQIVLNPILGENPAEEQPRSTVERTNKVQAETGKKQGSRTKTGDLKSQVCSHQNGKRLSDQQRTVSNGNAVSKGRNHQEPITNDKEPEHVEKTKVTDEESDDLRVNSGKEENQEDTGRWTRKSKSELKTYSSRKDIAHDDTLKPGKKQGVISLQDDPQENSDVESETREKITRWFRGHETPSTLDAPTSIDLSDSVICQDLLPNDVSLPEAACYVVEDEVVQSLHGDGSVILCDVGSQDSHKSEDYTADDDMTVGSNYGKDDVVVEEIIEQVNGVKLTRRVRSHADQSQIMPKAARRSTGQGQTSTKRSKRNKKKVDKKKDPYELEAETDYEPVLFDLSQSSVNRRVGAAKDRDSESVHSDSSLDPSRRQSTVKFVTRTYQKKTSPLPLLENNRSSETFNKRSTSNKSKKFFVARNKATPQKRKNKQTFDSPSSDDPYAFKVSQKTPKGRKTKGRGKGQATSRKQLEIVDLTHGEKQVQHERVRQRKRKSTVIAEQEEEEEKEEAEKNQADMDSLVDLISQAEDYDLIYSQQIRDMAQEVHIVDQEQSLAARKQTKVATRTKQNLKSAQNGVVNESCNAAVSRPYSIGSNTMEADQREDRPAFSQPSVSKNVEDISRRQKQVVFMEQESVTCVADSLPTVTDVVIGDVKTVEECDRNTRRPSRRVLVEKVLRGRRKQAVKATAQSDWSDMKQMKHDLVRDKKTALKLIEETKSKHPSRRGRRRKKSEGVNGDICYNQRELLVCADSCDVSSECRIVEVSSVDTDDQRGVGRGVADPLQEVQEEHHQELHHDVTGTTADPEDTDDREDRVEVSAPEGFNADVSLPNDTSQNEEEWMQAKKPHKSQVSQGQSEHVKSGSIDRLGKNRNVDFEVPETGQHDAGNIIAGDSQNPENIVPLAEECTGLASREIRRSSVELVKLPQDSPELSKSNQVEPLYGGSHPFNPILSSEMESCGPVMVPSSPKQVRRTQRRTFSLRASPIDAGKCPVEEEDKEIQEAAALILEENESQGSLLRSITSPDTTVQKLVGSTPLGTSQRKNRKTAARTPVTPRSNSHDVCVVKDEIKSTPSRRSSLRKRLDLSKVDRDTHATPQPSLLSGTEVVCDQNMTELKDEETDIDEEIVATAPSRTRSRHHSPATLSLSRKGKGKIEKEKKRSSSAGRIDKAREIDIVRQSPVTQTLREYKVVIPDSLEVQLQGSTNQGTATSPTQNIIPSSSCDAETRPEECEHPQAEQASPPENKLKQQEVADDSSTVQALQGNSDVDERTEEETRLIEPDHHVTSEPALVINAPKQDPEMLSQQTLSSVQSISLLRTTESVVTEQIGTVVQDDHTSEVIQEGPNTASSRESPCEGEVHGKTTKGKRRRVKRRRISSDSGSEVDDCKTLSIKPQKKSERLEEIDKCVINSGLPETEDEEVVPESVKMRVSPGEGNSGYGSKQRRQSVRTVRGLASYRSPIEPIDIISPIEKKTLASLSPITRRRQLETRKGDSPCGHSSPRVTASVEILVPETPDLDNVTSIFKKAPSMKRPGKQHRSPLFRVSAIAETPMEGQPTRKKFYNITPKSSPALPGPLSVSETPCHEPKHEELWCEDVDKKESTGESESHTHSESILLSLNTKPTKKLKKRSRQGTEASPCLPKRPMSPDEVTKPQKRPRLRKKSKSPRNTPSKHTVTKTSSQHQLDATSEDLKPVNLGATVVTPGGHKVLLALPTSPSHPVEVEDRDYTSKKELAAVQRNIEADLEMAVKAEVLDPVVKMDSAEELSDNDMILPSLEVSIEHLNNKKTLESNTISHDIGTDEQDVSSRTVRDEDEGVSSHTLNATGSSSVISSQGELVGTEMAVHLAEDMVKIEDEIAHLEARLAENTPAEGVALTHGTPSKTTQQTPTSMTEVQQVCCDTDKLNETDDEEEEGMLFPGRSTEEQECLNDEDDTLDIIECLKYHGKCSQNTDKKILIRDGCKTKSVDKKELEEEEPENEESEEEKKWEETERDEETIDPSPRNTSLRTVPDSLPDDSQLLKDFKSDGLSENVKKFSDPQISHKSTVYNSPSGEDVMLLDEQEQENAVIVKEDPVTLPAETVVDNDDNEDMFGGSCHQSPAKTSVVGDSPSGSPAAPSPPTPQSLHRNIQTTSGDDTPSCLQNLMSILDKYRTNTPSTRADSPQTSSVSSRTKRKFDSESCNSTPVKQPCSDQKARSMKNQPFAIPPATPGSASSRSSGHSLNKAACPASPSGSSRASRSNVSKAASPSGSSRASTSNVSKAASPSGSSRASTSNVSKAASPSGSSRASRSNVSKAASPSGSSRASTSNVSKAASPSGSSRASTSNVSKAACPTSPSLKKSVRPIRSPLQPKTSPNVSSGGSFMAADLQLPQRPSWCFVSSGIKKLKQKVGIQKFKKLVGARESSKFTSTATHLIIGPAELDGNPLVCQRTLKYFQAIAGHRWVVGINWVIESMKLGQILPEEDYEVQGDSASSGLHFAPQRSRTQRTNLLQGYEVCCLGDLANISADDLNDLVEQCGGGTVLQADMFSFDPGLRQVIVMEITDDLDLDNLRRLYRRYEVPMVSKDWVLDSIGQYKVQRLTDYAISLTGDSQSTQRI